MTKSSKRGLLTFLTVVALAMCAFASYGISAAANAAEETKAEKFTRIVSYFKDETIDDDLLVSEHALEFAGIEGGNAVFLYQSTEAEGGLSAEEKAGLDPEIKALYDEVYAIFEKPYAAKAKIADLYTLANTAVKDVMYADKAKVEEARALYDDLTENGRTFVKNALVNKDDRGGKRFCREKGVDRRGGYGDRRDRILRRFLQNHDDGRRGDRAGQQGQHRRRETGSGRDLRQGHLQRGTEIRARLHNQLCRLRKRGGGLCRMDGKSRGRRGADRRRSGRRGQSILYEKGRDRRGEGQL